MPRKNLNDQLCIHLRGEDMLHPTPSLKRLAGLTFAAATLFGAAASAQATAIQNARIEPLASYGNFANTHIEPTITSGALPDSPAARVDPNVPSSAFSGVVSINIRYDGQSFICSGALVSSRSVVSAGHCVDTDGNGHFVDLKKPGTDVRVIFNSAGDRTAIVTATGVTVHPDYKGFGNCPAGVDSFCVNDDLAVITLGSDAPASAKIYKVFDAPITSGKRIIMAGYGTSGDGVDGYYVNPSFFVKRSGENYIDLFDADDEQGFTGRNEVWYADFDGGGKDTFCDMYGVCTPQLPNNREAGIGGGDSGGPSFIDWNGELWLVANNTFSGWFDGQTKGTFGTYFGGILLNPYADFLRAATGNQIAWVLPEPGSIALLGLGAMMLLGARRRSKK
jgi:hypothetical protein